MENPADNRFPIHPLLQHRWSTRAFSGQPLSAHEIGSLLEAARWAPSSFNAQPWHFLLATRDDPAEFARMEACIYAGNRAWAADAPVLLLGVAELTLANSGEPNAHATHDLGLAIALLTVQATAMGLFVHQLAGFDADLARDEYNIPEGYQPVTMLAIGHPGDPAELPAKLQDREQRPRTRKPFRELVYAGTWGKPAAPVVEAAEREDAQPG